MPEEHTGQLGFDHAWKELLHRAQDAGEPGFLYLPCSRLCIKASLQERS